MSTPARQPRIPQRWLFPLRLAAIVIAYIGYRFLSTDSSVPGSAMVGVGFLLVAYAAITQYGVRSSEHPRLLIAGQVILGLGLVALGLFLVAG